MNTPLADDLVARLRTENSEQEEDYVKLCDEAATEIEQLRRRVELMRSALEFHRTSSGLWKTVQIRMPLKDFKRVLYGDIT